MEFALGFETKRARGAPQAGPESVGVGKCEDCGPDLNGKGGFERDSLKFVMEGWHASFPLLGVTLSGVQIAVPSDETVETSSYAGCQVASTKYDRRKHDIPR